MKLGIIGCGLIGAKRFAACPGAIVTCVADENRGRAEALAARGKNILATQDWREVLASDVEAVVIATPHHLLAPITMAALTAGKHVLVEKPAAIHPRQIPEVAALAEQKKLIVHVGFNHRYHRAFRKAHELVDAHDFGKLMFIRGRYGHGGRPGMEKEWRAKPELSGGGELIDQGVHLIDLSRQFMGDFKTVLGRAHRYFWNMEVEDNGFMILETAQGQTAFLQASCTEWKNLFSFEVYFERAKLVIDGLGGSYGTEKLTYYRMLPEMGPPETTAFEYPMADDSWAVEFAEFAGDIRLKRAPAASLRDAQAALEAVHSIYAQSNCTQPEARK